VLHLLVDGCVQALHRAGPGRHVLEGPVELREVLQLDLDVELA